MKAKPENINQKNIETEKKNRNIMKNRQMAQYEGGVNKWRWRGSAKKAWRMKMRKSIQLLKRRCRSGWSEIAENERSKRRNQLHGINEIEMPENCFENGEVSSETAEASVKPGGENSWRSGNIEAKYRSNPWKAINVEAKRKPAEARQAGNRRNEAKQKYREESEKMIIWNNRKKTSNEKKSASMKMKPIIKQKKKQRNKLSHEKWKYNRKCSVVMNVNQRNENNEKISRK